MGENKFMTLTQKEFIELYMSESFNSPEVQINYNISEIKHKGEILPAVDWRRYTKVRD